MFSFRYYSTAKSRKIPGDEAQSGLPGASLKSFEVPQSYYDDITANAVPQRLARRPGNRWRPFQVDETKTPDSYGLPREQIEELRNVIIQGSGMVVYP